MSSTETKHQREMRRKRNAANYTPPSVTYTTRTGIERVRTLHPTKGWRDANLDRLATGMALNDATSRLQRTARAAHNFRKEREQAERSAFASFLNMVGYGEKKSESAA